MLRWVQGFMTVGLRFYIFYGRLVANLCPVLSHYTILFISQYNNMQSTNIIQDIDNQIYCIIDPLLCLQQAITIPFSSLLECRYCRAVNVPKVQAKKYQCPVCKCFTDLPENYMGIVPIMSSNIVLTDCKQSEPLPMMKKFETETNKVKNKLKLLIVCESEVSRQFYDGLQCLVQILPQFKQNTVQIGLIMYDQRIKIMELEPQGRIIVVSDDSISLINDKYYPICQDSINQLFAMLSYKQFPKTTLNCTKVLNEILKMLVHTPTVVVWLGNLNQSTHFYPYPVYPNIQICCILKIPHTLTTHSQLQSLKSLHSSSTRTKYLLRTDTPKIITQKIHYQLYDLLWNWIVTGLKIEGSRERKYPPEILTRRERVLGSMRDCVIVRLGKKVQANERVQIRISYTDIIRDKEQGQNKEEQPQVNQLNSSGRTLLINFTCTPSPSGPNLTLLRYLQLYKLIKQNPTNLQLHSLPLKSQTDIQILQFLRECSYLQKHELQTSIHNCHCIYAVWPWVGLRRNQAGDRRGSEVVKFVYYFTGYYVDETDKKQYKKRQKDSEEPIAEHPYQNQIENLNTLCQVLYSVEDKRLPVYYEHIVEDIHIPEHLQDSDNEEEEQARFQQQKCEDNRYYQYRIK